MTKIKFVPLSRNTSGMYLRHLSIINFKNIAAAEIDCSPNINCIVGNNGEGKTNLLDAIYHLSMAKSCFGGSDSTHITHGEAFFLVQGKYEHSGNTSPTPIHITCGVQRTEGKVMKRDGKKYERLADHLGLLPLVIVSPADGELINESGEARRKYLNTLLVQIDRPYLDALTRYNHVLAQRNKLLKAPAPPADLLHTLNEQLAQYAHVIYNRRKTFLHDLQPHFANIYQTLSENKEHVTLGYHSDLDRAPLLELLQQNAERDRLLQHTTTGVHRDDLTMHLGQHPLRRTGSQGQQKTFLIALKLAQYEFLKQHTGRRPLLLLDDIFDKLDEHRVRQLIALVAHETYGQIFLTDSNKIRLNTIVNALTQEYAVITMENGTPVNTG